LSLALTPGAEDYLRLLWPHCIMPEIPFYRTFSLICAPFTMVIGLKEHVYC